MPHSGRDIWKSLKGHLTGTKLRKQLFVSTAGTLALFLGSKVLMFAVSVLLARLLGASEYGVYATCNALLLMLLTPATLGLAVLVLRMVAHYKATSDWGLTRGLLLRAHQAVLLASGTIVAIGAAYLLFAPPSFQPPEANAIVWTLCALPLVAVGMIRSSALRGLGRVALGQLPESLVMPATFVAVLSVWFLAGLHADGATAMAIRTVATFAGFVVGSIALARTIPAAVRSSTPQFDTARWSKSIPPLVFLSAMNIATSQVDVLLLAAFRGASSAGIYQTAARGAELVAFSLTIVNFALQPALSSLNATNDKARLQRLITYCTRATFALTLVGAIVLALASSPLMALAFGGEFRRGATCLATLALGWSIVAALGSGDQILNMTGHEKDVAMATAAGTAANLALNLLLIPRFDIEGAAIGTMTSIVLGKLLLAYRVRAKLGLSATVIG